MNLTEISDRIDEIGNAWEHFKSVNDEKLKQIEKKGVKKGNLRFLIYLNLHH